ncbi:FAD binding domain-containing protein [Streptomyces sp. 110]|uniref:FAD binding domain-containing protein n=1 Tax=Streptomyces endocoffeicus TaxID=2898945 RepID=A0ABS1PXN8_9ACTN|nr:FAD binding domain-containing protein [Streptomyces endocoffeicus]MBL1116456.1 FAD binding domain-containing protein [Streptomyces endocoffeicus]
MKPAPFAYVRATSVADTLAVLDSDPQVKLLAGGQSLLAVMNLRLARPSRILDIGQLRELDRVFDDDDSILIGALRTHRRVETDPLIRARVPLLAEAARHIGHVAIRNRGTLGGSLAHADPAGELPAAMVALGATLYVESHTRARREIAAEDFFTSLFTTALEPSDMLTWIRVPASHPTTGWGFTEVARRHGDFALAGAAAQITLAADGVVTRARAVLFGVADRPVLVTAVEQTVGNRPDPSTWRQVAREAAAALEPADEPEYQRHLAVTSLTRAFTQAADRSRAAHHRGTQS